MSECVSINEDVENGLPLVADNGIPIEIQREGETATEERSLLETIAIWVISLILWIHFIIVIPACESNQSSFCENYYKSKTVDGYVYQDAFFIVLSVVYVFYWIMSWTSSTRLYLSGHADFDSWNAAPTCWFKIDCFHKGSGESESIRVDTHSAIGKFEYSSFTTVGRLVLPESGVARIRFTKKLTFADDYTQRAYDESYETFISENDNDTHKEATRGMNVSGFCKKSIVFRDPENVPFQYRPFSYFLSTALTVSVLHGLYIKKCAPLIRWELVKKIKLNEPECCNP